MYFKKVEFAYIAVFMLARVAFLNEIAQRCKSDKGVVFAI